MASATVLSKNDSSVLSALFDPESSPSSASQVATILASLPTLPSASITPTRLAHLKSLELTALRPLNTASPNADALAKAITSLTEIIQEEPDYASAWNNRVQALRMLHGDLSPSTAAILVDLAHAIVLASPPAPTAPVSPFQAKILASAHTQYAHILYKLSKQPNPRRVAAGETSPVSLPPSLQTATSDELEEMASGHFALGGRFGNEIAREMAVRTNPYAKLCGSIVKEALMEEVRGGRGVK